MKKEKRWEGGIFPLEMEKERGRREESVVVVVQERPERWRGEALLTAGSADTSGRRGPGGGGEGVRTGRKGRSYRVDWK